MTYNVKRETNETIAMGEVTLPDIAPGERGFAHFSLPENFHDGDILQLQAFSSNNDEICRWTAPIHRAEEQSLARRRATSKLDVDFDANGIIRKIACNDKLINLANGPIPVGLLTECYKHEQHTDGEDIINTFWYRGGIDSIQWRQTADGRLMMDAVLLNDGGGHGYEGDYFTPESKWQVGLTFDYPEQIFTNGKTKSVSYLGNGPYRVWRNRLKGQQFGVWTKEYNNTITGQYNSVNPPVYPEFKGYHANVRWMQFPDFRVTSLTEALYIRLYTPEEPVNTILGEVNGKDKRDNAMIPFPAGDVSFLLSIPAMRSYKPLDQLGPLAQPDNIRIKPGDEGFHIKLVFEFE
jgi:hypothetical protein